VADNSEIKAILEIKTTTGRNASKVSLFPEDEEVIIEPYS